ncbi:unnamed protein product [Symbiodinium pilosum]|uniref:Uncharacterized protein n=1 Tax=Symbiodinium pilosum TaxID=2952 RepID=A0A812W2Y2_SYMPI|nr:unnamed protein product [Symbiodinium pilosum]
MSWRKPGWQQRTGVAGMKLAGQLTLLPTRAQTRAFPCRASSGRGGRTQSPRRPSRSSSRCTSWGT